ncbi:hypothetical protein EYF80_019322 [Liparis tanakae]|uniref:Uncharacterized protein n=1 Tax=Liparis tanakae TaxID=230148 RepID=A0A4Z2HYP5_9TELE|nr:hypothetical protein EYF80_019322 [Liparis tanakae]
MCERDAAACAGSRRRTAEPSRVVKKSLAGGSLACRAAAAGCHTRVERRPPSQRDKPRGAARHAAAWQPQHQSQNEQHKEDFIQSRFFVSRNSRGDPGAVVQPLVVSMLWACE